MSFSRYLLSVGFARQPKLVEVFFALVAYVWG